MTTEAIPPHLILERYVNDRLGRVRDMFAESGTEDMYSNMVNGVAEQLSCYMASVGGAKLKAGEVRLRVGKTRSYVLVEVRDRGGPLRLRDAMRQWAAAENNFKASDDGDTSMDWAFRTISRRWRFIDRCFDSVVEPLVRGMAEQVTTYFARKPYAMINCGLVRILEDVDRSYICAEIDDQGGHNQKDVSRSRYEVQ